MPCWCRDPECCWCGGGGKYIEFADKALTTIETLGWKGDHYVVSLVSEVDSVVKPGMNRMILCIAHWTDGIHIIYILQTAFFVGYGWIQKQNE